MKLDPRLASTACFIVALAAGPIAGDAAGADRSDAESRAGELLVYIGTYTGAKSKGIYLGRLDSKTGALKMVGLAAETANPSFLAIHPNRRFVYAATEIGDFKGKKTGAVGAFARDAKSGKLTLLGAQPSKGAGPCHLVVDETGRNVLVANYSGGSVACLPIGEDGRLGPATGFAQHEGSGANPKRQKGPHAHSINVDPTNRFAVAADLGLDKLLVYRFDAGEGTLAPNEPPAATLAPGAGPRHFAFHPSGRWAYAINELDSTVTACAWDAKRGVLKPIQAIGTLPEGFRDTNYTAEVQVHPSGRFLYGSNRGHDSIAVFSIDAETGRLTAAGHQTTGGKTPRNFGIDPAGKWLLAANQASDTIVVFGIDQKTGALKPTANTVEVPAPVCVKMIPADD